MNSSYSVSVFGGGTAHQGSAGLPLWPEVFLLGLLSWVSNTARLLEWGLRFPPVNVRSLLEFGLVVGLYVRATLAWLTALAWGSDVVFWGLLVPTTVRWWVLGSLLAGRGVRVLLVRLWLWLGRHTTLGWLLELLLAWCLRGSKAPPPVLRVEEDDPGADTYVGTSAWYTKAVSTAENVPRASVAAGGLTPSRVRKRAVWVRRLEDYLGSRGGAIGRLVRGRWEPDLPSTRRSFVANALLGLSEDGLKLLGGGALLGKDARPLVYVVAETPDGREVLFPELLGRLARFSAFRCRDSTLWAGLRSRASEWCKDKGLQETVAALVLPTHVARAFLVSATERLATSLVENHGYDPALLSSPS
jgi:hypothetical protein